MKNLLEEIKLILAAWENRRERLERAKMLACMDFISIAIKHPNGTPWRYPKDSDLVLRDWLAFLAR